MYGDWFSRERPHEGLGCRTPDQAHAVKGRQASHTPAGNKSGGPLCIMSGPKFTSDNVTGSSRSSGSTRPRRRPADLSCSRSRLTVVPGIPRLHSIGSSRSRLPQSRLRPGFDIRNHLQSSMGRYTVIDTEVHCSFFQSQIALCNGTRVCPLCPR